MAGPPPPPPGNAIQVTLQPAQLFQTWEAWRGSLDGPNFIDNTGADRDVPPLVLSGALDDLANDLGINGVRLTLHHSQGVEAVNDDSDPNHINWTGFNFALAFRIRPPEPLTDPVRRMREVIQPLRQRVLNRGEPFNIYVSLIYPRSQFPAQWLSNPEEYAELAQAYILWLQQQSPSPPGFAAITPNYWTIVNEPDANSFTTADIAALIPAVGRRLASMHVSTKIETAESVAPNINFLNAVLNTAGVSQYIGLVSFHGYDYNSLLMPASFNPRNQIRAKAQSNGVRIAMSEICCRSGWNGSYNQALGWARDIYWNMTEADISLWEPLALLRPCATMGCTGTAGQDALLFDADLSKTFKLAPYYALRQYSHFIRPGYRRVGTTCSNCSTDTTIGQNVKPVAFQSPAGKVVVVVINDQSGSQAITLNGMPAGTYDITGVSVTNQQSPVSFSAQTIGAGQAVTLTFPAQAIVTFAQR